MKRYDISIVGNGIVAYALAHLLSKTQKVLLISDKKSSYSPLSYIALNKLSIEVFNLLGIKDNILKKSVAVDSMKVYDYLSINPLLINENNQAYICQSKIIFDEITKLRDLFDLEEDIVSSIKDNVINSKFKSDIIINAQGRDSKLLNQTGFNIIKKDDRESALVFNIKVLDKTNNTAVQVFTDNKVIGMLPISDFEYAAVFSVDNDSFNTIKDDKEALLKTLIKILDNKLSIESICDVISFPLLTQYTDKFIEGDIILVGDCAHAMHPLAGLGLNTSLSDVYTLYQEIKLLEKKSLKLRGKNLKTYECVSSYHRSKILSAISFSKYSFSTKNILFKSLKSAFFKNANKTSIFSRFLTYHASSLDVLKRYQKNDF